jgi:hypothetical protein
VDKLSIEIILRGVGSTLQSFEQGLVYIVRWWMVKPVKAMPMEKGTLSHISQN